MSEKKFTSTPYQTLVEKSFVPPAAMVSQNKPAPSAQPTSGGNTQSSSSSSGGSQGKTK